LEPTALMDAAALPVTDRPRSRKWPEDKAPAFEDREFGRNRPRAAHSRLYCMATKRIDATGSPRIPA